MESGRITTPFGRRAMTLGMLASQFDAGASMPETSIDKWKLFRAICEARAYLGVTDRALAVLNALLTFYPKNELAEETGLVVFPSNAQLALRAHGIAPATLRRHLAALVQAGLLIRRDSPNGKRYAHKDRQGQIEEAFGFSLAPLLSRAAEIEALATRVVADRQMLRLARERLSLCRRDIAKLIETAFAEAVPGDWATSHEQFRAFVMQVPRNPGLADVEAALASLQSLRQTILKAMEKQINSKKISANESQTERHIQNSKSESTSELEPASDRKQGAISDMEPHRLPTTPKSFPLAMVLQACPEILPYGPDGTIGSWRDLMSAAVVVRSMLGVSPSAYQQACEVFGPENAATVIACVLERAGEINSAGGYLRDLTRRAALGEFSIGPMVMALMRANAGSGRRTG